MIYKSYFLISRMKKESGKFRKWYLGLMSGYKIAISLPRIILGLLIIFFGFNLPAVARFILTESAEHKGIALSYVYKHLLIPPERLIAIFALSLIILSVLEIMFSIAMMYRKKWGVEGLIVTSILWIPLEIMLVSKFFVLSKTWTIILNLIILWLLFDLLIKHKSYFIGKKKS